MVAGPAGLHGLDVPSPVAILQCTEPETVRTLYLSMTE